MKRVLVLTFTEVARDPRVMRHVAALNRTYDVVTCGKGQAPTGVVAHLEIPMQAEHLPMTPSGLLGLAARRSAFAYEHLPAVRQARDLLQGSDFDLAIANDIVTLPVALEVAARRPVIADLHEYAPREMEEDWRWRLMVQPFATQLCARHLPRAAAVTTVAPGIAREYQRVFGVHAVTLTNAGPFRDPQARAVATPIKLVHSGGATRNRRLEVMIDAAADIAGLTFDLYLVPTIRSAGYIDELRERASRTSNVRVLAPVPMEQVPGTLDRYHVGLYLLAPTSFNNEHALPNKFFDFVQSGLATIIGPSPEMAELVHRFSMGKVLPDFARATLTDALLGLTAADVEAWMAGARRAAPTLSSDHERRVLVDLVNELLA